MQSSLPASAPLQEAVFGMVEAIRQSIAAIKGNEATERSTLQSTPCLLPFYYYYTEQLCSSCGPGFSTAHGSHNEVTSPRWSWLGSGAGPVTWPRAVGACAAASGGPGERGRPGRAMGAAAAEADRTLFVGNLDPRVTEELIFELFHQAGPVIKVKIPKDRDGKQKQFAFVNFKHEESVPYGMSLLNGIKLYGRPIKIQFRSGSSHASQDGNSSSLPHGTANTSPSGTVHPASSRYDKSPDNMVAAGFSSVQRSLPSPDNLQRQGVMHGAMRQQSQYGGKYDHPGFAASGYQHGHSFNQSSASQMQWRPDVAALRKTRMGSHPYYSDSRHFGREQRFGDRGPDYCRGKRDDYGFDDRGHDSGSDHHYRGSRDDFVYEDRNRESWSHDYDNRRENYREGKWRPSRH